MKAKRLEFLSKVAGLYRQGLTYAEMRSVLPKTNSRSIAQAIAVFDIEPRGSKNNGRPTDKTKFESFELSPTWAHELSTQQLRKPLRVTV